RRAWPPWSPALSCPEGRGGNFGVKIGRTGTIPSDVGHSWYAPLPSAHSRVRRWCAQGLDPHRGPAHCVADVVRPRPRAEGTTIVAPAEGLRSGALSPSPSFGAHLRLAWRYQNVRKVLAFGAIACV